MQIQKFTLSSPAFENLKAIPSKYANTGVLGGKNISIPLVWKEAPRGTKSFAITIVDLHPIADNWIHWLVINIPGKVTSLQEGGSTTRAMPVGSLELNNTFGKKGYGGPQPPKGSGLHKYEITIYALNTERLTLNPHTSLARFTKVINGKVLASATIIGVFERI